MRQIFERKTFKDISLQFLNIYIFPLFDLKFMHRNIKGNMMNQTASTKLLNEFCGTSPS